MKDRDCCAGALGNASGELHRGAIVGVSQKWNENLADTSQAAVNEDRNVHRALFEHAMHLPAENGCADDRLVESHKHQVHISSARDGRYVGWNVACHKG